MQLWAPPYPAYIPTQAFADVTGVTINKGSARNIVFCAQITGADVAASLVVQGSIDNVSWHTISTTAVTTSSDPAIEVESSCPYVRLFCDYTSGTGNITVTACCPGMIPAYYQP